MQLSMQFTLRQIWYDPRLRYSNLVKSPPSIGYVTIDDSAANSASLWTPDIMFGNEASSSIHQVMKPNSYKRIFPDGMVLWSTRLTSTMSCQMDLRYFPFDKPICPIILVPFSSTTKDMHLMWDDEGGRNPITLSVPRYQRRFSKFDLVKSSAGKYICMCKRCETMVNCNSKDTLTFTLFLNYLSCM